MTTITATQASATDFDYLPIWGSDEVVTTVYGAGSDFTTSIDYYTDGLGLERRRPAAAPCSEAAAGSIRIGIWSAGAGPRDSVTESGGPTLPTPPNRKIWRKTRKGVFPSGHAGVNVEVGLQAIDSVRKGDRVWAFDHANGEWMLRNVLECYESTCQGKIVAISVADEVIEATLGHPFWVIEGQGLGERRRPEHSPKAQAKSFLPGRWVDAGDLQVGDILLLKQSTRGAVSHLEVSEANEKVYNFKVDELHCYAVGRGSVLVHNNSVLLQDGPDDQLQELLRNPGTKKEDSRLERPGYEGQRHWT